MSPASLMSVTCAQCELAVICEEIGKSVSHLPLLRVLQCAAVPSCNHRPRLYMAGPLATLSEPASDGLGRNVPETWPAGGYYVGGLAALLVFLLEREEQVAWLLLLT